MKFRQLQYFIAIVECSSLSRAGGRLHVAQPALSQHVRQLEAELGVRLLDRTARGVSATEAGCRLYQQAKVILAEVAQVPEIVRQSAANPTGEVRFGMSGTVCELVGVPLMEAARTRYPGVRLRPVEAMSGYILDWLKRAEVDVALVYASANPRGLATYPMLIEDLCLLGRRGSRIRTAGPGPTVSLATALTLDLITPGAPHALRELIDCAARKIGQPLKPAMEIDAYRQIKQLVARGAGFAILPETAVRDEVAQGTLQAWRMCRPALQRRVYLAHMKERPLSAAARAVAILSGQIITDLVRSGAWTAQLDAASDLAVLAD